MGWQNFEVSDINFIYYFSTKIDLKCTRVNSWDCWMPDFCKQSSLRCNKLFFVIYIIFSDERMLFWSNSAPFSKRTRLHWTLCGSSLVRGPWNHHNLSPLQRRHCWVYSRFWSDFWPLSWFGSSHGTFLPRSPSLEVPQCADSRLSAVRARQTDSMAAGCSWKDATVARDVSIAGRT